MPLPAILDTGLPVSKKATVRTLTPSSENQQNGMMEKVVFADGTRSAAEVLARAEGAAEAQEVSNSASSSADQQPQLAERAKKLLEDAQAALPLFGKNGAATK